MLPLLKTLNSLDVFTIPVAQPQRSGPLRTKAFFILVVTLVCGYLVFLLRQSTPVATQHIVPINSLSDFQAIASFQPSCPCSKAFTSSDFEVIKLPPSISVDKVSEWGQSPPMAPPPPPSGGGAAPPPFRPRPRFVPFFSSPRHFCRRAYEMKQACTLSTDTCVMDSEGDNSIRTFVTLTLEDIAYFCRQLANSVETSRNSFIQSFSDSAELLPLAQFNTTTNARRQQLASSLYYNSRFTPTEIQHYSDTDSPRTLDISFGATNLDPPGCRCAANALGNFTPFTPCKSFTPWWAGTPTWPTLTCSVPESVSLLTPINFLFNGTWWEDVMEAANMSLAFREEFGEGFMEPSIYSSASVGTAFNLYYIAINLFQDSISDFVAVNTSTSAGSNVLYDAPSLVYANYTAYYDSCAPTTCTYVTYVKLWWSILVAVGVALGSIYNLSFLIVYFTPEFSVGGKGETSDSSGGTSTVINKAAYGGQSRRTSYADSLLQQQEGGGYELVGKS